MKRPFKDGDRIEWRALNEKGEIAKNPPVDRQTTDATAADRLRSESGGSLLRKEENPPVELTAPVNPLAEMLCRLLPLAEKWLEKQVGQVEAERPAEAKQMLTPKEASPLLNLHVQTVMAWCREGKLDAVKIGGNEANGRGGRYLIPREAIENYLHKQRVIHGERRRSAK